MATPEGGHRFENQKDMHPLTPELRRIDLHNLTIKESATIGSPKDRNAPHTLGQALHTLLKNNSIERAILARAAKHYNVSLMRVGDVVEIKHGILKITPHKGKAVEIVIRDDYVDKKLDRYTERKVEINDKTRVAWQKLEKTSADGKIKAESFLEADRHNVYLKGILSDVVAPLLSKGEKPSEAVYKKFWGEMQSKGTSVLLNLIRNGSPKVRKAILNSIADSKGYKDGQLHMDVEMYLDLDLEGNPVKATDLYKRLSEQQSLLSQNFDRKNPLHYEILIDYLRLRDVGKGLEDILRQSEKEPAVQELMPQPAPTPTAAETPIEVPKKTEPTAATAPVETPELKVQSFYNALSAYQKKNPTIRLGNLVDAGDGNKMLNVYFTEGRGKDKKERDKTVKITPDGYQFTIDTFPVRKDVKTADPKKLAEEITSIKRTLENAQQVLVHNALVPWLNAGLNMEARPTIDTSAQTLTLSLIQDDGAEKYLIKMRFDDDGTATKGTISLTKEHNTLGDKQFPRKEVRFDDILNPDKKLIELVKEEEALDKKKWALRNFKLDRHEVEVRYVPPGGSERYTTFNMVLIKLGENKSWGGQITVKPEGYVTARGNVLSTPAEVANYIIYEGGPKR